MMSCAAGAEGASYEPSSEQGGAWAGGSSKSPERGTPSLRERKGRPRGPPPLDETGWGAENRVLSPSDLTQPGATAA